MWSNLAVRIYISNMVYFGLIGFPLKNTFSKDFFTTKFIELGLNKYRFENYEIENIESVSDLVNNQTDLRGLCVTIPHKISIIKYLDEINDEAKKVGAVNCVKILRSQQLTVDSQPMTKTKKNKLIGYNTDIYGFENSLEPFIGSFSGKALILGTGGAAKAVAYVLQKLNIDFVFVSRNNKLQTSNFKHFTYEMLDEKVMSEYQLIINCTPVGMFPNVNDAPTIPYHLITPQHFAYDLIYLPDETLFIQKCKAQGAKTINGLKMLHLQAEKAWEIFNDDELLIR